LLITTPFQGIQDGRKGAGSNFAVEKPDKFNLEYDMVISTLIWSISTAMGHTDW
jgi:hypothetical protein